MTTEELVFAAKDCSSAIYKELPLLKALATCTDNLWGTARRLPACSGHTCAIFLL
jgi:hypothetical protein